MFDLFVDPVKHEEYCPYPCMAALMGVFRGSNNKRINAPWFAL